jgi:retinol-binding protein 3
VLIELGFISSAWPAAVEPIDAAARREVAAKFAEALTRDYAYADKGAAMAAAIRAKLEAGGYDQVAYPGAFPTELQADARAVVDDHHLRVWYTGQPEPTAGRGPPSPQIPARLRKANGLIPMVEILAGNVGYMRVNGMPPPDVSKDAIAAAFAFVRNTEALIIDLRDNRGGEPATVALYDSYLSEGAPYVTRYIHWRKNDYVQEFKTTDFGEFAYGAKRPVFLLTSHRTFSAGEGFAYDVQAFKHGVVVGETTAGGADPGGVEALGHGFMTFMPMGYAVNPVTNTNWEGVGVKPDVDVPTDQALIKAELLAVERLRDGATDPTERAALSADALYYQDALLHPPNQHPQIALSPEALAAYTGTYIGSPAAGFTTHIAVRVRGSGLFVQADVPNEAHDEFEAFAESETRFFAPAVNAEIIFAKDADATVNSLAVHHDEGPDWYAQRIQ